MRLHWLILATFALVSATSQAATIQARLIRASSDKKIADEALKDIEPKLKKRFGYPYYQQLGAQQEALKEGQTYKWNLGEGFVVFLTPKSPTNKTHQIDLEWTSGRASLVKSTVKIPEGGHVFIKGPEVANDWIVLAISIRE